MWPSPWGDSATSRSGSSILEGWIREEDQTLLKARDEAIGSFVSRTREDDLVLFISDHGFQSVTRTIHMDHLLKKLGFLEFSG